MVERTLHGCRVLVVEDEYFLADDLRSQLLNLGAVVLGPVGTVEGALELIRCEAQIDGAILDVNLGGEMAFAVADALLKREVPFAFATGYDQSIIPKHLVDVARYEKPIDIDKVAQAIGR